MYKDPIKSVSTHIVKARSRQGTKSLDLTIPVKVARAMDIKEGDVFSIEVMTDKEGKLTLLYTRIFKNKLEKY